MLSSITFIIVKVNKVNPINKNPIDFIFLILPQPNIQLTCPLLEQRAAACLANAPFT
jgi:hypothetical protein